MITIHDTEAIEAIRSRNAVQPHRMKRFRNALFKHAAAWDDALAVLPEAARADFERSIKFECLELSERHDSAVDGASKLIFKTRDGHLIESVVLRPRTGRTSICLSSQVGCACQCAFCATGKMGFRRDLSLAEILDQVCMANRMLKPEGRTIRNVVFMGMGEPLLNTTNVFAAVDCLRAPRFFDLADARLTVSTVGIPEAMARYAAAYPKARLALSLHSARQEVRAAFMPMARSHTLDQLRGALAAAAAHGKVMIEYLMLAGVNDRPEDLAALTDYLRGIPAHINLIAFNAFDGGDLRGTPQPEREAFGAALRAAGFEVTLRYSMGADIAAACGQLIQDKARG